MLAEYKDLTVIITNAKKAIVEVGNWDYAVIQVVGATGTMSISATNDGGAIQGTSLGSWKTSANYTAIQATKLADGTSVSALVADGLYRIGVVGRYLQIGDGTTAAATKCIIMLSKIS